MSEEAIPRDIKIIHLILASMNLPQYQDHVPLQLLDFAHRYTTQVFQDALVYSDYANQNSSSLPAGIGAQNAPITVEDVKLAVSARVAYQFKPTNPKELLLSLAAERNKRPLPSVPNTYGLRLPPEKHCLTGRERELEDDDVVIAGYEKINLDDAHFNEEDEEQEEKENDAEEEEKDENIKQENDMDVE